MAIAPLDSDGRAALVDVLNRQFLATYPSIIAPPTPPDDGQKVAAPTPLRNASAGRFDRAVEQRLTHLIFDVQAFRVSRNQDAELFVRATWTAEDRSAHMSFWLRCKDREFIVERTSAWWARQSRLDPLKFGGRDFSPLDSQRRIRTRWLELRHRQPARVRKHVDLYRQYSPAGLEQTALATATDAEAAVSSEGPAIAAVRDVLSELTRAFKHRNYRLFFSGQLISLTGTWMQSVAESWLVYRLTGSSALLGVVRVRGQIPVFLFATIGGTVADRVNRHRIIVITQTLSMVLPLMLAALTLTGPRPACGTSSCSPPAWASSTLSTSRRARRFSSTWSGART